MHLTASRLVLKWSSALEAGAATIPVNADCKRFTSDTIALVAFGADFDSVTECCQETEDLGELLGIILDRQIAGPFK